MQRCIRLSLAPVVALLVVFGASVAHAQSPAQPASSSPATGQPASTASEPGALVPSRWAADLERPSDLAERLPKALIHHNVPGRPVYELLQALDRAWAVGAPYSTFGPRQRWVAAVERLAADGWPVVGGRSRWRLGEVTLRWSSVSAQ